MGVVSVEVGGASGRRFAVRMGLFMWGGCERREGREEKGWAAARACRERTFQWLGQNLTDYCRCKLPAHTRKNYLRIIRR